MKILSLFDWMACWYEALLRAWIKIDKYYASEIDKYAIQIALKNHPDIIEIWDVCNVKWEDYQDIDLLIWGSPCQWFSVAWKQLAFDDPRSKLFFEFVRLKNEINPKYFLLENVKMKKERIDIISWYLGVEPIEINSALVSAQSRKRLYWTNIPWVVQPENKWLILKDILQDEVDEKYNLSEEQMAKMKYLKWPKEILRGGDDFKYIYREWGIPFPDRIDRPSRTILTSEWHMTRTTHIIRIWWAYWQSTRRGVYDTEWTAPTITASMWLGGWHIPMIPTKVWYIWKNWQAQRVYSPEWKSVTLKWEAGGMWAKTGLYEDKMKIRKLTPIECERLQTLPDNYTEWVSDSQRYKMLGNWWTVDVIAHIFRFMECNSQ
jgi:DNA (cytosine-5)-methyltransferase 3A